MDRNLLSVIVIVDHLGVVSAPLPTGTPTHPLEWVLVVTEPSPEHQRPRDDQPSVQIVHHLTGSRSEARNLGLMAARGDSVAFLDDPTHVPAFSRLHSSVDAWEVESGASAVTAASWRASRPMAWSASDDNWLELIVALMAADPLLVYDVHALRAIGGFSCLLGPGRTARGGDAFDVLVRLLQAGHRVSVTLAGTTVPSPSSRIPASQRKQYLAGIEAGAALGLGIVSPKRLSVIRRATSADAEAARQAPWLLILGCLAGSISRYLCRLSSPSDTPAWSRVWCGVHDLDNPEPPASTLETTGGVPYDSARFLVRSDGRTLGFVSLPLHRGRLSTQALQVAIEDQIGPAAAPRPKLGRDLHAGLAATVAVCTRNRAHTLGRCLAALSRLQHEPLDILIIDNAPSDDSTEALVRQHAQQDPRIRYVREPHPGLSYARNRAISEARAQLLAFTDDDVIVDEAWLNALMAGFDRSPQVACVTGLVASASLETAAEQYFDQRVWWSSRLAPRMFTRHPEPGDPGAYPFTTGAMGTGANLAFRRDALIDIGGFDEALGAGAPTAGGEDLDIFVRLLLADYAISYEPDAVVWHEHRVDDVAARRQLRGYGKGLAAYLVKYLTAPTTRMPLMRRLGASMAHALTLSQRAQGAQTAARTPRGFASAELMGLLMGPAAYLRARRSLPQDRQAAVQPR